MERMRFFFQEIFGGITVCKNRVSISHQKVVEAYFLGKNGTTIQDGPKKTVIPRGEITPLIGVIYNPNQTHLFEAICSFCFFLTRFFPIVGAHLITVYRFQLRETDSMKEIPTNITKHLR